MFETFNRKTKEKLEKKSYIYAYTQANAAALCRRMYVCKHIVCRAVATKY